MRSILKGLGLKFGKPYLKDYRRPDNDEKQCKNIVKSLKKKPEIIGFFDEFSPQTDKDFCH